MSGECSEELNTSRNLGSSLHIAEIGSSCISVLGSYQVCHSVCMAAISILAVLGITFAGMPLLFLTKVALPFWIIAVVLFFILLVLNLRGMHCISNNSLAFNSGLLIIGIPFLQEYYLSLWVIGGVLVVYSCGVYVKRKLLGGGSNV